MSKALIPYVPRPSYTQIMQQVQAAAFASSFSVQQNDMRLRDCTDVHGWLRAAALLPNGMHIQNPYIFKASKVVDGVEKSFLALGTMHILPLAIYPQPLIDILLRQTVLVTESKSFESRSEQDEVKESKSADEVKSLDVIEQKDAEAAEWFEALPARVQHHLADIIGDSLNLQAQPEEVDVTISALIRRNGMDLNLIDKYRVLGRTILGLETDEDVMEAIRDAGEVETRDEIVLGLIEGAEESLAYGGFVASPEPLSEMESHLSGKDLDSLECQGSVYKRSNKWLPELLKILDKYPTEILLDGGLWHLFLEGGILTVMYEDGWKIERTDLGGESHPFDLHEHSLI